MVAGVSGMFFTARAWWGWAMSLGSQVLWIIYSVSTRQWGFLVSVAAFSTAYTRNMIIAYKKEHNGDTKNS